MRTHRASRTVAASCALAAGMCMVLAGAALAHCDTVNGPVVPEARAALEKGDVTPILKWVQPADEAEIKTAFTKAVAVRSAGPEAKEMADQYFLETLVRLHRAGEGEPYTGIKDEPVEAIVAMADAALAAGSADEMIARINDHMAQVIREKFQKAAETRKTKDRSVDAGREFVAAYVTYMHYVEGVHAAIVATGAHHGEAGEGHSVHKD